MKMYTKTVCPKCMVAKSFFDNNDILYEAINLDQNESARDELVSKGFMAAPIVEFEGKYYTNMNEFQELVDQLS
ncbi:hypothetical protein AF332_11985 [Sporosarcina globispora]|uniref:Glutaredoxin domain-containing protein n=2 Tax=Sporosarcina globispora TaxID=1459 RepID=A0A0M0GK96_SPOGL|nr:hypothetical protein AF332_11985 [Sporosarcina globispora]